MALKAAVRRAKPVLSEPILAVEVVTPEEFMGEVIGDLNRRRGQVHGMERRGNAQVINAECPWPRCSVTLPTYGPTPRGRAT